jgi:hypothetical protein
MVCPYCSTDMEPIELNGKVFCSNCGLTIKSGQPTRPANTIMGQTEKVEDIATNVPEEVQFPVIPEENDAPEQLAVKVPEVSTPDIAEEVPITQANLPAEPTEPFNPITQEAEEDLGLTPPPELESKIPDIGIPSETDFENIKPTDQEPTKSYLELANPGNELDALGASGILLDILAEEPKDKEVKASKEPRKLKVDVLKDKPENPIQNPELESVPATEELAEPEITSSKINKGTDADPIDPKTEKKIEKLEKKIEDLPDPDPEITPEEAHKYDPDAVKAKAIKEYFDSALSDARNQPQKNSKKPTKTTAKKPKKKLNEHGPYVILAITLAIVVAVLLGGMAYYIFATFVRI